MNKILIIIIAMCSQLAFAAPDLTQVDKTINQLKKQVSEYSKHHADKKWLIKFKNFLKLKVEYSFEKKQLIEKVCSESRYYQECSTGALGFYSSAVGAGNAIEVLQTECEFDSSRGNCPYYQRMLNSDIAQLKFLLQVVDGAK
jgi:hypothetical protein